LATAEAVQITGTFTHECRTSVPDAGPGSFVTLLALGALLFKGGRQKILGTV
jgi:hypothetical protein